MPSPPGDVPAAGAGRSRRRIKFPPRKFRTEAGADLTPEQIQFGAAIDRYKRRTRNPFPTYSEILTVVHALGYRLVAEPVDV